MGKQKPSLNSPLLVCGIPIIFFLLEAIRTNAFDTLSFVLAKQFQVNALQYARLSSVYLFANLIFLIPYGVLLDRISTKSILLFSMTLCCLAALGEAISNSYSLLLIFSFLAGAGASPIFIISMKLIKERFAEKHLALLTSILVCAAMVGGIVSQSPLLYFLHHFSWHHFYFILAILEVCLFLLLCFVSINPTTKQAIGSIKEVFVNLMKSVSSITNWISGLFTSLLNLPVTLIGAIWGQSYLQVVKGFSAKQSSIIITFIFIGLILGLPVIGYISDKTQSRMKYMFCGAVMCLFCSILMLTISSRNVTMFIVIFLILGVASSVQTLGYTIACENNPIQRIGVAMGLVGIIVMSGGAFLQPFIGLIIDSGAPLTVKTSSLLQYNPHNYQLAFMLFPIAFFIAVLLVCILKIKYK